MAGRHGASVLIARCSVLCSWTSAVWVVGGSRPVLAEMVELAGVNSDNGKVMKAVTGKA